MAHVLLIDDDPHFIAEQVRQAFSPPAYTVSVARSGAEGVASVRSDSPDVVLLDTQLPDRSGLEVYEEIRGVDARLPVIFVTVAKAADTAIEAMKRGAFDYIYKPIDLTQLQARVLDAVDLVRRMRTPVVLQPTALDPMDQGVLFGACPAMLHVYKAIGRVADQDVTVLVTGESGTGKELVARAIYQHSARSGAPLLAMNCAAIPDSLIESELFGHEKGSFTGADRRRIGKFEQCSGGTILLDEIGDMSLPLQSKLLRLLQEEEFERVGGNETIRTDVRLIAATHRDLRSRVAEGQFRLDLYYRIGVFTIHLPPLRERGDDIALLALNYVRRFSHELGREVRDIAPETMERLRGHSWPGNVRELQSVLKQAVLQAHGFTLLPAFLPPLSEAGWREGAVADAASARHPSPGPVGLDLEAFIRSRLDGACDGKLYAETRDFMDRLLFTRVLEHTNGNLRAAAEVLGISRQTVRIRLRALGISIGHVVEQEEDSQSP
jgi:two-component system, NtrC family, response regulator AtoC